MVRTPRSDHERNIESTTNSVCKTSLEDLGKDEEIENKSADTFDDAREGDVESKMRRKHSKKN